MASLDEFLEKRKISADSLKKDENVADLIPAEQKVNTEKLIRL